MRDIGDRDQQAKTLALAFAIHRVVEVARGFAVDGDKRQVAQIGAAFDVGGGDFFWHLFFQRLNIIGPDVGQIVLAQRDLDFHAGIGVIAQHFGHARDRFGILCRLRDQLDHHYLAGFGTAIETRLD